MPIRIDNSQTHENIFPLLRKWINPDNKHLIVLFFNKSTGFVLEASENSGFKVGDIKEFNPFDFSTWRVVTATVNLEFNCKF